MQKAAQHHQAAFLPTLEHKVGMSGLKASLLGCEHRQRRQAWMKCSMLQVCLMRRHQPWQLWECMQGTWELPLGPTLKPL